MPTEADAAYPYLEDGLLRLPRKEPHAVQVDGALMRKSHTMSLGMSPSLQQDGGPTDPYLEKIRAEIPEYDRLQEATIAAIPFSPARVLDLGIGTGETSRRLLSAYPDARVTGLDANPEMVFRARELLDDVRLARMEDPLPDGPWDLVISALSVHLLDEDQERDLFRRVREQSRALVIADRFGPSAPRLASWCEGEITWQSGDLAVIRATYR